MTVIYRQRRGDWDRHRPAIRLSDRLRQLAVERGEDPGPIQHDLVDDEPTLVIDRRDRCSPRR